MSTINVKFKNYPVLHLAIDSTDIGQRYYNLVKETYDKEPPIYRDTNRYTVEYMSTLVRKAKEVFGWNWEADEYNLENAPLFHKDLEITLKNGFGAIPAEYDYLVHELHYGLHKLEHGIKAQRTAWLQIEWYNDAGFDLDRSFNFNPNLNFGDVKLQNPWVGHGPLQIFEESDFTNISQTCKFHDFVKPGINISTSTLLGRDTNQIIDAFKEHDPMFVEMHGEEKIKHYTGYPVIGHVTNLDDLEQCLKEHILVLDSLSFDE